MKKKFLILGFFLIAGMAAIPMLAVDAKVKASLDTIYVRSCNIKYYSEYNNTTGKIDDAISITLSFNSIPTSLPQVYGIKPDGSIVAISGYGWHYNNDPLVRFTTLAFNSYIGIKLPVTCQTAPKFGDENSILPGSDDQLFNIRQSVGDLIVLARKSTAFVTYNKTTKTTIIALWTSSNTTKLVYTGGAALNAFKCGNGTLHLCYFRINDAQRKANQSFKISSSYIISDKYMNFNIWNHPSTKNGWVTYKTK